jgi:hypothetical protein
MSKSWENIIFGTTLYSQWDEMGNLRGCIKAEEK